MPYFDLPLPQLRAHVTETVEPAALDEFWSDTLGALGDVELSARFEPVASPLAVVDTLDVTYAGFGGEPIRAWLHLPHGIGGPLPCVVEYMGYGDGRGLPHQQTFWASAGFAHLVMETRGQGGMWSVGQTPDPNAGSPSFPGCVTRGILDPLDYYYRRVYVDALRAVEAARAHPSVRADAVAVAGASQGGALAIAVAALRSDVIAAIPEVPFLCDVRRGTELAADGPYCELSGYLKAHRDRVEDVFRTLGFFDLAVLGSRASAPALFSVGLMDSVCPPSTVFAAYNAYGGPKRIDEYPFNDHEGGGEFHQVEKVAWLRALLESTSG